MLDYTIPMTIPAPQLIQSVILCGGSGTRLAYPGTIPIEIIEVQSGSYLDEDDIVRFEDNYGRRA